jgi:hypothetical protein
MGYNYAINDDVLYHLQEPQGRDLPKKRNIYTITARLPVEVDGRSITGSRQTESSSALLPRSKMVNWADGKPQTGLTG